MAVPTEGTARIRGPASSGRGRAVCACVRFRMCIPVSHPERATKHCSPATSIGRALMKGIWERSTGVSACSTSAAAGPCSARMPLLGSVSTDASLPTAEAREASATELRTAPPSARGGCPRRRTWRAAPPCAAGPCPRAPR